MGFFKNNYLSLGVGLLFYILFLYYNTSGSQLCDCEATESYRPSGYARGSVNHFYHKQLIKTTTLWILSHQNQS
jgi:hypothetical protein